MDFSPLKGTRDFYPEDYRQLEFLFDNWKQISVSYGFQYYESPLIESMNLYKKKSGDEIESQLYAFEDKGGRAISLRPEITLSLARMVINKGGTFTKPLRWFSIPRLNRYENPQKGRLREFFQFNIDIIGSASVVADAEVICCAVDSLRAFKLTDEDFEVRINDRKVIQQICEQIGFSVDEVPLVYKIFDKKGKVEETVLWDMLKDAGVKPVLCEKLKELFNCTSLEELKNFIKKVNIDESVLSPFTNIFEIARKMKIEQFLKFDISIVRGLAYYTGVVFEIFAKKSKLRAIAGGGRYDNLIKNLSDGKYDLPAVGFGIGDAVLTQLLEEKNLLVLPERGVDYYGVYFSDAPCEYFLDIVSHFRSMNKSVVYSLESEKLSKQLKNASKLNASYVFIVGDEEIQNKQVKVKDMKNSSEIVVGLDDLMKK